MAVVCSKHQPRIPPNHLSTRPSIHSLINNSIIHPFIHSFFSLPFIYSSITPSFIHSYIPFFINSFIHSLIENSFLHSFIILPLGQITDPCTISIHQSFHSSITRNVRSSLSLSIPATFHPSLHSFLNFMSTKLLLLPALKITSRADLCREWSMSNFPRSLTITQYEEPGCL